MTYTIKLSETSKTQFLCQLSNGTDTYYIKFANTEENISRLTVLLDIQIDKLTDEKIHDLPKVLEEINFEKLISEITQALDKHTVSLSETTNRSIENNAVLYTYRNLDKYKEYWDGYTPYSLFNDLSEDIIEIPYADKPNDMIYRGKPAYHENHGTNHAVRQYILIKNYLALLKREGNPDIVNTANQVSKEEQACIELAGFLFRSGRTNEQGWSGDSTYGKRSAEIFCSVAEELGFNKQLINLIAQSYNYHGDLIVENNLPNHTLEETIKKAQLFRALLELSHESDLVRCDTESEKLESTIKKILANVLCESSDKSMTATSFLNFAAKLCSETGARVDSAKHRQQESDQFGNETRAVITTHSVVQTCNNLNSLKPYSTLKCTSPTKLWFNSEEHVYKDEQSKVKIWSHDKGIKCIPQEGWTEEQIQLIPTEQCIKHESKYAEDYLSVYHATTKASRALELFCNALAPIEEKNITWHRISKERKQGVTYKDIEVMKLKSLNGLDNTDYMAWHLLSCNPTLWQNADYDSQESTVDYFLNNSSVKTLDFSDLIFELLDARGLLVGYKDKREELAKQFNELVNSQKYGKQGIIYQYLIPHHLIDKVAYISRPNGKLDLDNASALDTLYALKTGVQVPNHNTFQVRLLVSQIMDPTIANQLKVKTHSTMSEELALEFQQIINKLANEAITGPTEVIKQEENKKEDNRSKFDSKFCKPTLTFFPTQSTNTKQMVTTDEDCVLFDSKVFDFRSDDEDDKDTENEGALEKRNLISK